MKLLRVEAFGTEAQGIRLYGDVARQVEPPAVRIAFPGGEVSVERATDGPDPDYWVHVRINSREDVAIEAAEVAGRLTSARLDVAGRHTSDLSVGDFENPGLYHLAVRVARDA